MKLHDETTRSLYPETVILLAQRHHIMTVQPITNKQLLKRKLRNYEINKISQEMIRS